jgi:hypothetical protein
MNAPTPQEHFDRAREFQEYYQDAVNEIGLRIPGTNTDWSANKYRRETVHSLAKATLQNHELGTIDYRECPIDAFNVYEPQVLKAAVTERRNPANYAPGDIKVFDPYTGRVMRTDWVGGRLPNGEQTTFLQSFTRAGRRVKSFCTLPSENGNARFIPEGRRNIDHLPVAPRPSPRAGARSAHEYVTGPK